MRRTARLAAIVALGLLLSACHTARTVASGPTGHGAPAGDAKAGTIVTGPGPQSHYTVQPQPAPGSCRYGSDDDGQPLPDASCTPGAISPAVTKATIGSTICRQGGYTATIRPPASITDAEKRANAKSYAYTGSLHDAEYDST